MPETGKMKQLLLKMYVIKTARSVMLGITIDNKLNLDGNIRKICKKYGQKSNDFSRIPTFPNDQKRNIFTAISECFLHDYLTI